ncbi:T9SS type A sorting domain-containing protein [bacterium]|nr:T9SS type A sorting domain-containing protein [bacterium]
MKKYANLFLLKALLILVLVPCSAWAQTPDTLRIANYNILYFSGNTGPARVPYFRDVVQAMNPDILVVQEMSNQTGVNIFLNDILNVIESGGWEAAPFYSASNSENACFYRPEAVEFVSTRRFTTQLRYIEEYVMRMANDTTAVLRLYSAHLKASQGSDNEQRRLAEATIWRNNLNLLPEDTEFLAMGDFNLYTSSEPAYQMLIGEPDNVGRCFDPIDTPGDWHNDESFADIHTQCPRGGSYGGMDDRFDFILASRAMFDTVAFEFLEGSCTSFGNDGNHFNMSINEGENTVVPDSIADALYDASDHLPVYLDLLVHPTSSPAARNRVIEPNFELFANFPNPFNNQTVIQYSIATPGLIQLQVFDLLGRRVATLANGLQSAGIHKVSFEGAGLASGIYYYSLSINHLSRTRKMLLIR